MRRSGSGLGAPNNGKRRKSGEGVASNDPLASEVSKAEISHYFVMHPWLQAALKCFDNMWARYEDVGDMLRSEIEAGDVENYSCVLLSLTCHWSTFSQVAVKVVWKSLHSMMAVVHLE